MGEETGLQTLRDAILSAGSQEALARLIDVDPSAVSRWVRGARAPLGPSRLWLAVIAYVPEASWPEALRARCRAQERQGGDR